MLRVLVVAVLISFLGSEAQVLRQGRCPNVEPFPGLDVKKYLGVWYEQMHSRRWTGLELKCSLEYFESTQPKTFNVNSFTYSQVANKTFHIRGVANIMERKGKIGMLSIKIPDFGINGEVWVLGTDYTSYTVMWSCMNADRLHFENVVVMTRQPEPTPDVITKAMGVLIRNNIPRTYMQYTSHRECPHIDPVALSKAPVVHPPPHKDHGAVKAASVVHVPGGHEKKPEEHHEEHKEEHEKHKEEKKTEVPKKEEKKKPEGPKLEEKKSPEDSKHEEMKTPANPKKEGKTPEGPKHEEKKSPEDTKHEENKTPKAEKKEEKKSPAEGGKHEEPKKHEEVKNVDEKPHENSKSSEHDRKKDEAVKPGEKSEGHDEHKEEKKEEKSEKHQEKKERDSEKEEKHKAGEKKDKPKDEPRKENKPNPGTEKTEPGNQEEPVAHAEARIDLKKDDLEKSMEVSLKALPVAPPPITVDSGLVARDDKSEAKSPAIRGAHGPNPESPSIKKLDQKLAQPEIHEAPTVEEVPSALKLTTTVTKNDPLSSDESGEIGTMISIVPPVTTIQSP